MSKFAISAFNIHLKSGIEFAVAMGVESHYDVYEIGKEKYGGEKCLASVVPGITDLPLPKVKMLESPDDYYIRTSEIFRYMQLKILELENIELKRGYSSKFVPQSSVEFIGSPHLLEAKDEVLNRVYKI